MSKFKGKNNNIEFGKSGSVVSVKAQDQIALEVHTMDYSGKHNMKPQ